MISPATFLRSDSGALSVEFVLWLPVFLAVVILSIEASMAMTRQSEMYVFANALVRRAFDPTVLADKKALEDELEVLRKHANLGQHFTTSIKHGSTNSETDDQNGTVLTYNVEISIPYSEVFVFGDFLPFNGSMDLNVALPR